jgi:hypothetical protein
MSRITSACDHLSNLVSQEQETGKSYIEGLFLIEKHFNTALKTVNGFEAAVKDIKELF